MNLEVLHGSRLQKRTCNEPESRVALTSHDRSIAQACDLWALRTWQYWRQVPQRKNYIGSLTTGKCGQVAALHLSLRHSYLSHTSLHTSLPSLLSGHSSPEARPSFSTSCYVYLSALLCMLCVFEVFEWKGGHSFFLQICPPINLCWGSLWLWPSKTKAPISCFSTPLKAEMGTGASPTDIQDKHPDATSSCALWRTESASARMTS